MSLELLSSRMQSLLMLAVAVALAGCSGSGMQSARGAKGSSAGVLSTSGANGALSDTCSGGQSAVGGISADSSTSDFTQNVLNFVSATEPSSSFGTVSGTPGSGQGISFQLYLPLSGSQLVSARAQMQITIYDSFVGQSNSDGTIVLPYSVPFTGATSGSVDAQNKTFNLVFSDNVGSITVQGRWSGSTATGTVSFQNTANVNGGSPASGNLGTFSVPTCGLF